MNEPLPPPRLNLSALPSLTTLLFALIAGVILVAIAAGLVQNPSELGLLLAAGMLVLPLRDFMQQPERVLRSLSWSPRRAETPPPPLVQDVQEAAQNLGLDTPPRLLVTPQSAAPVTLGTWRRRYLILGHPQAEYVIRRLSSDARRALWLHEVAHFAHGDHWKVELSRSLLRVSVVFAAWSAFFLLGVVILALVYGLEMLEPGFLNTLPSDPPVRQMLTPIWPDQSLTTPMLERVRAIHPGLAALYVLNAYLPFVISGIVLLLFVWRLLVQAREFYADARVAIQMKGAEKARSALGEAGVVFLVPSAAKGRFRAQWANLCQWFDRRMPFHPSWDARYACLENPLQVFGSWKRAGFTAGLTVLLLDLILAGPFTLGYVSAGPAHFATLAGFVILALWLLPGVCQGFVSTGHMVRQIVGALVVFMGLRAGWLLLNTMLLFALLVLDPALARTLLNATVLLSGKVLTPISLSLPEDPVTLALLAIAGGWSFTALVSMSLLIVLLLAGVLLRRMLTWYAFPAANRWLIRVCLSVPLALALVLGLIVLPLPTALIQGDLMSWLQPIPLVAAGMTLLIAMIWGIWFVRADRRYGRRCPSCGGAMPGWFTLGKKCACGHFLHPWLLANY